jgi:hypothetical protein
VFLRYRVAMETFLAVLIVAGSLLVLGGLFLKPL